MAWSKSAGRSSAVCCDRDAKGASFRFFGVYEEAVVGGRLLCNGEQPRIFRICKECEGETAAREGRVSG